MNGGSVKQKLLIIFLIQAVICLICFMADNIRLGVFLSFIHFCFSVLAIHVATKKIITFGLIFLSISYALHMGNLFATQFLGSSNTYLYSLSDTTICKGILYFLLSHTALAIGLCSASRKRILPRAPYPICAIDKGRFMQMGILCTLVGVLPRIYIDYQKIKIQLSGDYLATFQISYGWLGILAQFFYVGILTILFLSGNHKNRARFILISVSLWEIATMLSGGRMDAISFVIAMVYVYITKVERPRAKHVVLAFVILYGLSAVMSAVATIRRNGAFDAGMLGSYILASIGKDNPIVSMLVEMGGTFISLGSSIDNIPSYHPFGYGKTYISTVFSIIPAYESHIADIKDLIYIYAFADHAYLGGSWLGETFYNFSWFGCLFALVWGKIIGRFETIIKHDETNGSYLGSVFIVVFMYYMILYARDYFYRFTTTIQVFIVCVFVCLLPKLTLKTALKKR